MLKRWINSDISLNGEDIQLSEEILKTKNIDDEYRGAFLHPVFKVPEKLSGFVGLDDASTLLKKWISDNKRICIYSDYDVDGTSASAILLRMFEYLSYNNVFYYVPDRFKEGYGLNVEAIEFISQKGADAIVTVDCGIRAVLPIKLAKELGLEVLLTDHHSLPAELPKADIILNPKLSDFNSSHYDLCGAGVAMYLALSVLDATEDNYSKFSDLIQLSALATVADLVPLLSENRAIVSLGLELIKKSPIVGLKALAEISGRDIKNLNSRDIAFSLAPRINAAGRMESAELAISLLTTKDSNAAIEIAKKLNEYNENRRRIQDEIFEEIILLIEKDPIYKSSGIIIVWGEEWHEGVLGIVASKLVDKYHLPAIVLSKSAGKLKGSARSIEGFSIYSAIGNGVKYLERFGGHEMACGLSVSEQSLKDFIKSIKHYCDNHLNSNLLIPSIETSGTVPTRHITFEGIEQIDSLEPFGVANPEPIFVADNFNLNYGNIIGKNSDTLKMSLSKDGRIFDAIHFNVDRDFQFNRNIRVDIAFKPSVNSYNGITKVNCLMEDFRIYDPNKDFYSKTAFSIYAKGLIEWIDKSDVDDLTLCSGKKISKNELISHFINNKRIAVNNFESLLDLMYALFDAGYLSGTTEDFKTVCHQVKVLPVKTDNIKFFYGEDGIYGSKLAERKAFYRSLILNQLEFDRKNFGTCYLKLKKNKKMNLIDLLLYADKPINTLLALYFFDEANFLRIKDSEIEMLEGEHGKADYDKSNIKSRVDSLFMFLG